jgi:aldose 1-epimerase
LTCNLQPIDDCELTLPVIEETCDERYFTTPQRIAQTAIDHTFKTMPPDAEWEVRMTSASQNMTTFYAATSPGCRFIPAKISTAGLAVEPMTCPPDAFNSGISLIHLAPGEQHQMHFLIGAE